MRDTAPTRETLLEVNNIEVIYNHVILVLKGVSLTVNKGGITALLGGNGAGKTTTLKAISNLLHSERGEVTKGSIIYKGEKVQDLEPAALVKRGVIQVMEQTCEGVGRNATELVRKIKAAQYVRNNPGQVCPAAWEEDSDTLTPSLDLVGKI